MTKYSKITQIFTKKQKKSLHKKYKIYKAQKKY